MKNESGSMFQKMVFFVLFITTVSVSAVAQSGEPSTEQSLQQIFDIGTVQSLIISKNGEILHEEYRGRMDRNRPTNIKSASKSVLSLLVGIAVDQGHIESVDQTIDHYFPEYFEANPDSEKASITIKDLITMRSGLETTSFRNYGRWVLSSNWTEFALNQPLESDPGGRMVYSTGTSHLLSVILTKATGVSTRRFAEQELFGPLNIRVGGWDRDPQGYYMGGNNLAISPMALLKIGRLVMNLGEYNGEQIVSESWILDSMKIYTKSNFNNYNYGYMWWRQPVGDHEVVFAWGNGGQYIMMLPELNSVISITSDVESGTGSRRYQRRIFSFLEDEIIPFVQHADS